jgi:hypothetical protein
VSLRKLSSLDNDHTVEASHSRTTLSVTIQPKVDRIEQQSGEMIASSRVLQMVSVTVLVRQLCEPR